MDLTKEQVKAIGKLVEAWGSGSGDHRGHKEQARSCERASELLFTSKTHVQPRLSRKKLLWLIGTDEDILLTVCILVAACVYASQWVL